MACRESGWQYTVHSLLYMQLKYNNIWWSILKTVVLWLIIKRKININTNTFKNPENAVFVKATQPSGGRWRFNKFTLESILGKYQRFTEIWKGTGCCSTLNPVFYIQTFLHIFGASDNLPVISYFLGIFSHSLIPSTSRMRINYISIDWPLGRGIDIHRPPSAPRPMCIPEHRSPALCITPGLHYLLCFSVASGHECLFGEKNRRSSQGRRPLSTEPNLRADCAH